MSIYKLPSGRYKAIIAKSEGSTERRSLGTFATKKQAEKAQREALAARDRGIDLAPQTTTLAEIFASFMVEAEGDGLSGTTLRNYRDTFLRCEKIAQVPIVKLRPTHVSGLRATLLSEGWSGGKGPLSVRSVRNTVSFVATLLSWAVDNELVMRNVAAMTRSRRDRRRGPSLEKKPTRHYERDEALRLIAEASKTRHAPMIIFAFDTGLRRGELAGLRWSDVNIEDRIATVRNSVAYVPGRVWLKSTKTNLVAEVPLSDHAIEALRAQRLQQAKDKLAAGELYGDQGFVFAPPEGGTPSPNYVSRHIAKIALRAGLALHTTHGIRHSTGSWLIHAGVDVRTVAAILRHSSASTTLNIYTHEMKGAKAAAIGNLLDASLPTGTQGP